MKLALESRIGFFQTGPPCRLRWGSCAGHLQREAGAMLLRGAGRCSLPTPGTVPGGSPWLPALQGPPGPAGTPPHRAHAGGHCRGQALSSESPGEGTLL